MQQATSKEARANVFQWNRVCRELEKIWQFLLCIPWNIQEDIAPVKGEQTAIEKGQWDQERWKTQ